MSENQLKNKTMSEIIVPDFPDLTQRKLNFRKEENGNVTLRNNITGEIIVSFPAGQIVIKDLASPNDIVIKSALNNDKGIPVNCNDIDGYSCTPVIGSTEIDGLIFALSQDFFFEVGGAKSFQHIPFARNIYPQPTDNDCFFFNDGLSSTLTIASSIENDLGVLSQNENIQSNVLFHCTKATKLMSYSGLVYKTGFFLQIYKGSMGVDVLTARFSLYNIYLLASIPLDSYQQRIDLTQYITEPILENEVVIVTYKSPASGGLESYFWFNGTFGIEYAATSSVTPPRPYEENV